MDIVTVSCATSIIEGLEFYCDRMGLTSGRVGLILRAVGALQAIFADKSLGAVIRGLLCIGAQHYLFSSAAPRFLEGSSLYGQQ